jgi:predicted O-linked N-acetylglucosamine transferase (SPINDLY family)
VEVFAYAQAPCPDAMTPRLRSCADGWRDILGLSELVAHSEDEYVRLASELAGDLARLGELRSTLRRRMEQSPLMDAPRFARNVEAAHRQMWRNYVCAQGR